MSDNRINIRLSMKDAALLYAALGDVSDEDLKTRFEKFIGNPEWFRTSNFFGTESVGSWYFAYDFKRGQDTISKTRDKLDRAFRKIGVDPNMLNTIPDDLFAPEAGPTAIEEDDQTVDITPLVELFKDNEPKYKIYVGKRNGKFGSRPLLVEYCSLSCAIEDAIQYAADDEYGCYTVENELTGEIMFET